GALLTTTNELPSIGLPLLTATRLPVLSSPVQRKTLMAEIEPPTVKSLTRRMSPSVCAPVKGGPPFWVTFGVSPIEFRKNQKPAVESPLLSKRSIPAYAIRWPLLRSV